MIRIVSVLVVYNVSYHLLLITKKHNTSLEDVSYRLKRYAHIKVDREKDTCRPTQILHI